MILKEREIQLGEVMPGWKELLALVLIGCIMFAMPFDAATEDATIEFVLNDVRAFLVGVVVASASFRPLFCIIAGRRARANKISASDLIRVLFDIQKGVTWFAWPLVFIPFGYQWYATNWWVYGLAFALGFFGSLILLSQARLLQLLKDTLRHADAVESEENAR